MTTASTLSMELGDVHRYRQLFSTGTHSEIFVKVQIH